MLTRFGKMLKKIRVENDEILRDMATKLDVTAAYLSAVENGKRTIPDSWVEVIAKEYGLEDSDVFELQCAAYENKDSIRLNFDNQNEIETNLALSFARKFKDLNQEELLEIQKILNRRMEG